MEKIISTINSMITNKDKIKDIRLLEGKVYFFKYADKYIWSISQFNNNYDLTLYPDPATNYGAVSMGDPFGNAPAVVYRSSDYKYKEALDSFRDLYKLVRGKYFDLDSILDNIISG